MTTQTFNIRQIERALLSRSFIDFVTRKTKHEGGEVRSVVKVTEPPDAFGMGGGVIDFVLWEHLEEVIDLLGHERLISVMKARQIGLSWLIAAYALWTAMYHKAAIVMIFSQGQVESTALLRKIHSIWDEMPDHLKDPIGLDNSTTIEFPGMSSKILAYPSTEKAGRGETATVHRDAVTDLRIAETNIGGHRECHGIPAVLDRGDRPCFLNQSGEHVVSGAGDARGEHQVGAKISPADFFQRQPGRQRQPLASHPGACITAAKNFGCIKKGHPIHKTSLDERGVGFAPALDQQTRDVLLGQALE